MVDRNRARWKSRLNIGLPPICDSHEQAQAHLRDYGLALLSGAEDAQAIAAARDRLVDQAGAERRAGIAVLEGEGPQSPANYGKSGPNQRVWGLINKGEVFRRLACNRGVLRLISEEFRGDYAGPDVPVETGDVLLSSSTGNIVGSGGLPGRRHLDQRNAPFKTPYAMTFNAVWMLTDFTPHNGATLVAPGSHLATDPEAAYASPLVPAVAPAGTVMIMDGRLLHCTGGSQCGQPRVGILNYYCRPFMRPQENYCLSLRPEAYAVCSDELKALLGFKAWNTFGGVDGHHHGLLPVMRPSSVGELSLASDPPELRATGETGPAHH